MAELAKTHIEITDESMYSSGTSTVIPLYVIATAENKVIDEDSGEVAPGTTKETANEVLLMSSQTDVVETFGVPQFTTVDGTVQQGDELNEYGLFGLYQALGVSSLAYALRADVDLNQLKATAEEPSSNVANNTLWFDESETSYGLFRANGNKRSAIAWDRIDSVLIPSSEYLDSEGKPNATYGTNGNVAVVINNGNIKYFENISQAWYQIGSNEWKAQFSSSVVSTIANATVKSESVVSVMGADITIPVGATTGEFVNIVNVANEDNNSSILASVENGIITITNDVESVVVVEKSGSALEDFGFELDESKQVIVSNGVSLTYSSHTKIPSGENAGSIWVKTTEPNYGASTVMKKYSKASKSWVSSILPMFGTYLEAEENGSSMVVKYDEELSSARIMKYVDGINVVEATKSEKWTSGDIIGIETIVDGSIQSYVISIYGDTVEDIVKYINKAKISGVKADVNNGMLRIVSSTGHTIKLSNVKGNILEKLGLDEGEYSSSIWSDVSYTASIIEPTAQPAEGTMWFNDSYDIDIMVNNGSQWLGYKNMYANADIFITSEEPTEKSNGCSLQEYDLWIDTNSSSYPTIYRYFDGEWELVDNTDQTTPLGVVFADARENAGPAYNGSTHTEFSTEQEDLMISNYVDPECVNPLSYASGILLFNTMYSTNNVKEFVNKYSNGIKTYGQTFKVGKSEEFPTPGTNANVKTTRWSTKSGNALDGSGLFGRKAQRAVIVKALAEAINSNEDIRSIDYDFWFACCPGYPELDDEFNSLNTDKKEMFYHVSDTPARLAPKATEIQAWGSNKNNAMSHGEDGRVVWSCYQTRQYPPMALMSNVDGSEIAVPSSIQKMEKLLVLPRGRIAAGTQYGQITSAASVGYINSEEEYASVSMKDSLGEVLVAQSINPVMPRRNAGLLVWGESTENSYTSALSDEHTIIMLLRLKRELEEACQPFFFQLNTQAVRNDFDATLRSILNDYLARDEIYDFTLVTDSSVNTAERIERKELWAEIAIEPTKAIEQIYLPIRIVKTGSLSSNS